MINLLKNSKVIICVGTGGVGKTTVAASLGWLASELGLKTLVITVDPSQRLKSVLNLNEDGDLSQVPGSKNLFGTIIQAQDVFEKFIMQSSKDKALSERILKNRLYQQLSTNLSGSQEFTSLLRLLQISKENEFDLIILDTPPSNHAVDFFEAPQKLAQLFNESVTKWFRDPKGENKSFVLKMIQASTRQVLNALETLTGSEFMTELADFFKSIEGWQTELESTMAASHRLLTDQNTHFVLVTAFDSIKLHEAAVLAKYLKGEGYSLENIIINREMPDWMQTKPTDLSPENLQLFNKLEAYFQSRRNNYSEFENQFKLSGRIYRLPELTVSVKGQEELQVLAKWLKDQ